MLTSLSLRIALVASMVALAGAQAPADIAGRWVGGIDTDRGQMEIALEITHAAGKFSGEVKSAHGGWPITEVTANDGEWTIEFGTADNGGTMKGKAADGKFSGAWATHMATGTFELVRPKR